MNHEGPYKWPFHAASPCRSALSPLPFRRSRQRLDRRRLVAQSHVRVDPQGQPNVRMSGQGLSHLGRDPSPLETGDEQMPEAVKIGVQPVVVAVAEEVGREPSVFLGLLDPLLPGGDQVPTGIRTTNRATKKAVPSVQESAVEL